MVVPYILVLLVVMLSVAENASAVKPPILEMPNDAQHLLKSIDEAERQREMQQAEYKMAPENTRDVACYQDIGCFYKNGTFKHLNGLPDSPQMIQTSFALYTRENRQRPVFVHYLNSTSVFDQTFNPTKKLEIICHGFTMSGDNHYVIEMKDALLDAMDCNVIVIDWRRGALPPFYISAALDTELVGRQVGRLVSLFVDKRRHQITDVHIIGFSLGAHLAGFAGKWLKTQYGYTVERISALDPASFLFEGRGDDVHVSYKDALFVDVIHTSSGSSILSGELGMTEAVGHVDFYPNGGKQQPGCSGLICNHMRALDLFTTSIGSRCEFRAVACDSFDVFDDGGCFHSKTKQIGRMGYYSNVISGRGTLYLATTGSKPFCGTEAQRAYYHCYYTELPEIMGYLVPGQCDAVTLLGTGRTHLLYGIHVGTSILVMMSVSEKQPKTYGAVAISMIADNGITEIINITDSRSQKIHSSEVLQKLAVVNPSVLPLYEVHIHYTHYKGWFYTGTDNFLFDHMKILDEAGHIWFEYSNHGTKVSSTKSEILHV